MSDDIWIWIDGCVILLVFSFDGLHFFFILLRRHIFACFTRTLLFCLRDLS